MYSYQTTRTKRVVIRTTAGTIFTAELYNLTRLSTTRRSLRKSHADRGRSLLYPHRRPCPSESKDRTNTSTTTSSSDVSRKTGDRARNDILVRANLQISRESEHRRNLHAQRQSSKHPSAPFHLPFVMYYSNSCQRPRDNANASTRVLTSPSPEHTVV